MTRWSSFSNVSSRCEPMKPATPVISHVFCLVASVVFKLPYTDINLNHKERKEHKEEKKKNSLFTPYELFAVNSPYNRTRSFAALSREKRSATSRCSFQRSSMLRRGFCAQSVIAATNSSIEP